MRDIQISVGLRRVDSVLTQEILWGSCARWLCFGVIVLAATLTSCGQKANLRSRPAAEWQRLLEATGNAQNARSREIGRLLKGSLANDAPMWPVDTFLRAEVYRLRGDPPEARRAYRALAEWGAKNPYKDGWGGSGLTMMALWRWLEIASVPSGVDQEEVSQILDCAQKLQSTRLAKGMFSTPLLGTLPRVEEEFVRRLAQLAWSAGRKSEAERLFLDYLQLARTKERNEVENQMWQHLVETGQASEDHLTLLVAIRLRALGQNETAATLFRRLRGSDDADVRAQAGYHLARLGRSREVVVDMLSAALEDAANPRLAQQILFERAVAYNRPGKGRNSERFVQDLLWLISEFPQGSLVDSALYELAGHFQRTGDTEQALSYFERLENLEGTNKHFELSYYQAALALYTRAAPGDSARAARLLQELLRKRPSATLRFAALFWLGRLAAESGDAKQAQDYFRQIVEQSPYDYYAIRARMHLNLGSDARLRFWPDEQTNAELRAAYQASSKNAAISVNSSYADRLREVLQYGLYRRSLEADSQLRPLYPSRRLEELTPEELDFSGMFAHISLLLAFRQDALAATDSHPESRLKIAVAVGQQAQDWPLAIALSHARSGPEQREASVQQSAGFLATAYPIVFREAFRKASATYKVPPELLYGVVRRESFFYPSALSSSGALGVFQFIARTFRDLDRRWKLLETSGIRSYEEFLLNPDRSIDLGARWFREELLPANNGNLLLALVEHHAGSPRVVEWTSELRTTGRFEDVEYAIESIPYMETRRFLRGVTTDMAIITAAGILRSEEGRPSFSSGTR